MARRPKWPTSGAPKLWLETTAAWALALPPCAESRCYAHFAMEAMGNLGAKASVVRVADALLAKPCKSDVLRSVRDVEAIARVYAALGDERRARATIARLDDLEAAHERNKKTKKSDVSFVSDQRTALLKELGLDGKKRLAKSSRDDDDDEDGEAKRSTAAIMREVEAAFAELTPDEWNVHFAAGELSSAIRELHGDGAKKKADAVLGRALAHFATGQHDGRGFASAGAYVDLARAAFVVRGREAAAPLLEKALAVAGKYRQMVVADAALLYAAMGLVDEGLALAQKVRPEARRMKTVAEILFRGRMWQPLAKELARIRSAEAGALTGWTLSRIALGYE